MNTNIVIIGAGQLGSRHLQALAFLLQPVQIWVVDPSEVALVTARNRWNEVATSEKSLPRFVMAINQLPESIAVAIIATNSVIRRSIVESLLLHAKVQYVVLEKVLFPSLEDYVLVNDLLQANDITAWVNCPRRQYPGYQKLQSELSNVPLVMTVTGSTWGLACNSIHWVDIFAYLCKEAQIEVVPLLDEELFPSKRAGYIEFSGSILIKNASGSCLMLHCFADGSHPLETHIELPSASHYIQEAKQQVTIRTEASGWHEGLEKFSVPRQSQLSHLFVDELLQKENCSLTSYAESMQLHLPLIKIFLDHYNSYHKSPQNTVCPIT